jgi:hypothetical protein
VFSVPFPLRFLFASNPAAMAAALGIVYHTIATHLAHKAGFTKAMAQTGAVTLIQRFGSALNLNIHLTCMDALMSRAQEAQERPTCCSWMVLTLRTNTELHGFVGLTLQPVMSF